MSRCDATRWERVCVEQMAAMPDWWDALADRADVRHGPGGLAALLEMLQDLNDAGRTDADVCRLTLWIYGLIGAADEWDRTYLQWPRQPLSLKRELGRLARNLAQGHSGACAWARASCRLRAFVCDAAGQPGLAIERPGTSEGCQLCTDVGVRVPDLPAVDLDALKIAVCIASCSDALNAKPTSEHLDDLTAVLFTAFQGLTGSRANWLIASNPARGPRRLSGRGLEFCLRFSERFNLPIVTANSANRLDKVRRRQDGHKLSHP